LSAREESEDNARARGLSRKEPYTTERALTESRAERFNLRELLTKRPRAARRAVGGYGTREFDSEILETRGRVAASFSQRIGRAPRGLALALEVADVETLSPRES
jgi:hypothetical protein